MLDTVLVNLKDYWGELISDRKKLLKILLIVLILLVAVAFRVHKNQQSNITVDASEVETVTEEENASATIFVDISGAVNNPGVYEVNSRTRLYEVIEEAGGLTDDAYIDAINRAEFVEDGQKITIPFKSDDSEMSGTADGSSVSGVSANGLININTASKEELMGISGIGEVIAERIIEYRSSNRFKSPEDIMSVKGIGTATYEKMKDKITV